MATGFAAGTCTAILDAIGNATAYSVATPYIQLHTGDPGSAGTANVATETTRKSISFGAASGASIATDADITWTDVAGTEDFTHFTLWTASTAGTFIASGTITANAVTAGDTFTIPSGDLTLSLTAAS